MAIRITQDAGAPTASVELAITRPLPDYDLEKIEAAVPREVDPMLASQGFKDLLDEALSIVEDELAGSGLEITQLTGAICLDKKGEQTVYRPGLWLVVRETAAPADHEMSAQARGLLAAAADALSASLQIT